MPEASWLNLAIQIPIVVVFAYVMLKMQETFLKHLSEKETRDKAFIAEQREENNKTIRDLTERMCDQFERVEKQLDTIIVLDVAHDAFVRTSFLERFGPIVANKAAQAAQDAGERVLASQQG